MEAPLSAPVTPLVPGMTRRGRLAAFVVLCAAQYLVALDFSVVNVALPSIRAELGFSPAAIQWVVSAYALALGGFLMLGGRAADLYGRRRMFMWGLSVFCTGSVAGGLAGAPAVLIAARSVQGLGAAIVLPAALSLIAVLYAEGPERHRALGAVGAVGSAGAAMGVVAGGVITDALDWRWVFFINVPVAAGALALALPLIPRRRRPRTAETLDAAGALTLTGGVLALVYATAGIKSGLAGWQVAAAAALSVGLLAAFPIVERRARDPLMPPATLRDRVLAGAAGAGLLATGSFLATLLLLSQHLQEVLGYDALDTGLAFLPMAAMMLVGSAFVSARLVRRLGVRTVVTASTATLATGYALLVAGGADAGYADTILPATMLMAAGNGVNFTAILIAATSGVAPQRQGLVSGVVNTARQVGAALGAALLVTVAAASGGPAAGAAYAVAAGMALAAMVVARRRLPPMREPESHPIG